MCLSGLQSLWIHRTRNPWHQDVIDRHMYNCVWYIFYTDRTTVLVDAWHTLFCTTNNLCVAIWHVQLRASSLFGWGWRDNRWHADITAFIDWIRFYWWTKRRIQNASIAVHHYLRLMVDKTIPDKAPPSWESFYPPFVVSSDLPYQRVVDS